MRICVLGGGGMAGHMIKDYLSEITTHEIWYTVRGNSNGSRCVSLNVMDDSTVLNFLSSIRPDVVINAVGLLNEDAATKMYQAIYVNTVFPHKLAEYGQKLGYRLIHISTDCVFSGSRGNYTETDATDGITVYAKTKSLGEVVDQRNITIRTSIIGPVLNAGGQGLFNWFMKQEGEEVLGFRQVFWSGVTTLELAKVIVWVLERNVSGLLNLAVSEKISKYTLLNLIKDTFNRNDPTILPYDGIVSDKSLVNTRSDFSYSVPLYPQMLEELKMWMKPRGCYHHYFE